MAHSRAAMAFIWDMEKWWRDDVRLVLHDDITASSPIGCTSSSLSLGLEIPSLPWETSPTGVKSYVFPEKNKSSGVN